MKNLLFLLSVLFLLGSCISDGKKTSKTQTSSVKQTKNSQKPPNPKQKVGTNNYNALVKRTHKFADNLDFDLAYMRKNGLPDKKHLSEFLGLYLKLHKAVKSKEDKVKINHRIEPFYQETLKPAYHNMSTVDDKLFKKNSMSYMRIVWLLDQLGFDISIHKKELAKIQTRMDNHMKKRGEWQRAIFDWYYDYFKLKKPFVLKNAKNLKGSIATKKEISFYDRKNAYVLTHFVFAAYDYGNKITQTRFNNDDLNYLKEILPQLITKFEFKKNDDLVGELLACQVLIGDTQSNIFKSSFNRLMNRQNRDGSFGSYAKYKKKVGKDVEFRAYLHTTLVCFESFVEFEARKSVFN